MRTTVAAVVAALLVLGCSVAPASSRPTQSRPQPPPPVYVALGASETAGVGTDDPSRDAFPQQIYAHLPRGAVLYNLGIPAETTTKALTDELPAALAARPTLATVFFNVDDLVAGVSPTDFETNLDHIVHALRGNGHTTVLVANTARLDQLPAYGACAAGQPSCPLGGVTLPGPSEIVARIDAYNAVIAHVATTRGALLVDLSAAGAVAAQHPEYVSGDGFHPSTAGAAAIAQAFTSALNHHS